MRTGWACAGEYVQFTKIPFQTGTTYLPLLFFNVMPRVKGRLSGGLQLGGSSFRHIS